MGDLDHTSNDTDQDTQDVKGDQDYSRPDFSEDEENLIARMFSLVGERWSLIAGRIPGRTAEEIEKYWATKDSSSNEG
ncbi:MYB-like transcription factor ETC1 [Ricinus communis]|uniref:Triptychon and cpc, putative n=1 Tax=Ricinus communis TaxID=3988 RepID=B9RXL1_RICCO|nr:MYB-like transcription factor ETC1 [Ricinus communis]EEF43867.1 triptychon and cpc, putative [Ricinus communis]|eukprot:XP_002518480.1 MYB-like transcription factor ETC1 [Ricinus communis]